MSSKDIYGEYLKSCNDELLDALNDFSIVEKNKKEKDDAVDNSGKQVNNTLEILECLEKFYSDKK